MAFDIAPAPGMDRAGIDMMVDELERHLPRMLELHPDRNGFWFWFAGEAASIGGNVRCKADWLHVQCRLNRIVEGAESGEASAQVRPRA